MFDVNFLATSKGFFRAFTVFRNLISSLSERGPWLEGKEEAQSTESSSVSSHIVASVSIVPVEAGVGGVGGAE